MSGWKNVDGGASNIHWSIRKCCVFSWAKALNQRFEPRAERKVRPYGASMWFAWPPMPTSPMARGECAARIARQARGDLGDRLLPRRCARSVPSARRFSGCSTALRVLDVVADREALVADVAVRDRTRLVGPHVGDPAVDDVDPQAAVVAAQHADGGEFLRIGRQRRLGDRWIDSSALTWRLLAASALVPEKN